MPTPQEALEQKRNLERDELLVTLDQLLQTPMVILSFIMLALFLVELTVSMSPAWLRVVSLSEWFIWVIYVIEFAVKLALAPDRATFLRHNWFTALAVVLPVLRVFQVVRAARAVRSFGALRVLAVGNRSIRKLGAILDRRHLQYVGAVVVVVWALGAAGLYFLEASVRGANITTFGDALWWSAGTLTTVGTELYPITAEGRVLAVVEMVFGVSAFGYVAGALASAFVHIDRSNTEEDRAAAASETGECSPELINEIEALQERLTQLTELASRPPRGRPR